MNKLVVCSFEAALINSEDAIEYETMLEIDRVRKGKNYFCVITTRDLEFILEYNKDFPFLDYIIAYNGSYIYDVNERRILLQKKLPKTLVNKITKLFSENNLKIYTSGDIDGNVIKIEIIASDLNKLKQIYDTLVNLNIELNINIDKKQCTIEILPKGVNRENSLIYLINKLKLNKKDIFVIGAKKEDINNIKKYKGFTVANADKEIKNLAVFVSEKEDSKGVCNLLQKFVK